MHTAFLPANRVYRERGRRPRAASRTQKPNSPAEVDSTGLFFVRAAQLPAAPASVVPTSVRWKFRAERDAVGPRCPWYRLPYGPEP